MHDALICVDDYNREKLAIEIDLNLPTQHVIRVLDRIVVNRGYPVMGFEVQWDETYVKEIIHCLN
ncbi:integrase [Yersinia pestis]|nr:integrase [Yersinia pestis]KZB74147.1 integrase [Yersinia pestis]PCN64496.1 integrase [Yersinia pestis]PVU28102.1 integrase [Yersinia pestis]PVU28105.1 integrase [Yersinia pestis]